MRLLKVIQSNIEIEYQLTYKIRWYKNISDIIIIITKAFVLFSHLFRPIILHYVSTMVYH